MTARYSQVSNQLPQQLPCERRCKACGLYLNQLPSFEQKKQSHIFWVGLSAVRFSISDSRQPLSPATATGSLIERIEKPFRKHFTFYKTNLVKCLPLKDEKIRYPVTHEMRNCFPNLQDEIAVLQPSLVFLLGKQVSSFTAGSLFKKEMNLNPDFDYDSFAIGRTTFIPVHHPSYILVYKRKYLDEYINSIQCQIELNLLSEYEI